MQDPIEAKLIESLGRIEEVGRDRVFYGVLKRYSDGPQVSCVLSLEEGVSVLAEGSIPTSQILYQGWPAILNRQYTIAFLCSGVWFDRLLKAKPSRIDEFPLFGIEKKLGMVLTEDFPGDIEFVSVKDGFSDEGSMHVREVTIRLNS